MVKRLITFSGIARSGKDVSARFLMEDLNKKNKKIICNSFAFADKLKSLVLDHFKITIDEYNNIMERQKVEGCFIGEENFYEVKTPFTRAMLISVGKLLNETNKGYFTQYIVNRIKETKLKYPVITDLRFNNEYKELMSNFKDIIVRVNIVKPNLDLTASHIKDPSETMALEFEYDYVIINDGTLDDLKDKILELSKKIKALN